MAKRSDSLLTATDPLVERARFAEAIDMFAQRTDLMRKADFEALDAVARSKAWTVARVADVRIIGDLHTAVGNAIEGGQSWREFLDSLETIQQEAGWSGLTPWHARLVYETNVEQSWSAGRVTQARDAGLQFWRKLPSDSFEPRSEHARYDGQIFAFAEMSPPPWDYGCKCGWEPVFDDEVPDSVWQRVGGRRADLSGAGSSPRQRSGFTFRAGDFARPVELRKGDVPEELWPVIETLASDANSLLRLRG